MYARWPLFRKAALRWADHNAPRRGAALAYYTVLSLAPLLVIIVAMGGIFFGDQAVRGELAKQLRQIVGSEGALAIAALIRDAKRPGAGIVASSIGFGVLLLGASGVFVELRQTLNEIWDAPTANDSSFWGVIRSRFLSFLMILVIGILFLAVLVAGTVAHAVRARVQTFLPLPAVAFNVVDFLITLIATCTTFAIIYRFIPEVHVDWEDVFAGSLVTALLFTAGKFLLGLYIIEASVGSAYGAAGSLVVLLVWLYYSSQIFLYGAEITRVYADQRTTRPSTLQAR